MEWDLTVYHRNKISIRRRWHTKIGTTRAVLPDRCIDQSQHYRSKISWISTGKTHQKSWPQMLTTAERKTTLPSKCPQNKEFTRVVYRGRTKSEWLTWKSKVFNTSKKWACRRPRWTRMATVAKSSLRSRKSRRLYLSYTINLTHDP